MSQLKLIEEIWCFSEKGHFEMAPESRAAPWAGRWLGDDQRPISGVDGRSHGQQQPLAIKRTTRAGNKSISSISGSFISFFFFFFFFFFVVEGFLTPFFFNEEIDLTPLLYLNTRWEGGGRGVEYGVHRMSAGAISPYGYHMDEQDQDEDDWWMLREWRNHW